MSEYTPEIEYKFFPNDIQKVLENLEKVATKTKERTLMRGVLYRGEDNATFRDMNVLRVRDEGDQVRVNMKQRYVGETRMEHALEKEFIVSDFETTIEMFAHIGLIVSQRSEKYRTVWEYDTCEIMFDETPWIEPYFEIE